MKKVIFICISVVSFLLAGCGGKASGENISPEENDKVSIMTTGFAGYDFARQVGGDKVEVSMLLEPGNESHSFEPTPGDIIKIQNSDVFIYVGGESDAWVDNILEGIDISNTKIITLFPFCTYCATGCHFRHFVCHISISYPAVIFHFKFHTKP